MKKYCVYIHLNKKNNKKYIGITSQKPEARWSNGNGYKANNHFYSAIQKYGWDNFEHIIFKNNLTKEEACELEIQLIKKYNTMNSNYGYNLTSGGDHPKDFSEETREKLRISSTNRHVISEQGRKNISEARKAYIKKYGTPTQGKGHTEETKQKLREQKLGKKNPMYGKTTSDKQKRIAKEQASIKIQCIETGQIFNSRKDAAKWCGLKSASGISDYLSGKKKSAGKHPITGEKLHWKNID